MERKIWTILEIINWGKDYFCKKEIDSPRLTIELLLCKTLGLERIDLYSNFEQPLKNGELTALKEFVKRRANREPLQYILGETDFYGCKIKTTAAALIPRPETEELVGLILKNMDGDRPYKILDIGSGSGCIGIALAKNLKNAQITGIDISGEAIDLSMENAGRNRTENIRFFKCDILNSLPPESGGVGGKYDIVISNPPYISSDEYKKLQPEVKLYEPEVSLNDNRDGLTFYRRYAEIFREILIDGGRFFLEIGFGQSEQINRIFMEHKISTRIYDDINGIPRVVYR